MQSPPPALLERAERVTAHIREEYDFEPHGFETKAGWLHYLDEGPRSGAASGGPVLCLHGNPTWSFYYRKLVAGFSDERRVLALDHLGCGLSDKPQDWGYRLADHIANLEAFVLALDLTDITLVMHDWGGAIGMGFATRHPERVGRLMFGNTAAFPSERMPKRIAICRTPVLGPLLLRGLHAFGRAATFMASTKPLSKLAKRGYLAPYDSWANRIAQWKFVSDIPMKPDHPSYATLTAVDEGLPKLKDKPMAIAWGLADWCFTPKFLDPWRARFPDAEVLRVRDGGHLLLEDAPDEVLPFFRAFLERVEGDPEAPDDEPAASGAAGSEG